MVILREIQIGYHAEYYMWSSFEDICWLSCRKWGVEWHMICIMCSLFWRVLLAQLKRSHQSIVILHSPRDNFLILFSRRTPFGPRITTTYIHYDNLCIYRMIATTIPHVMTAIYTSPANHCIPRMLTTLYPRITIIFRMIDTLYFP